MARWDFWGRENAEKGSQRSLKPDGEEVGHAGEVKVMSLGVAQEKEWVILSCKS